MNRSTWFIFRTALLLSTALCAQINVQAAPKPGAKKPVVKKAPAPGVRGTNQMAGGEGVFGQTYTLTSGFNFTLVSAEYGVSRISAYENTIPKAGEKLIVLHMKIKNSGTQDQYFDTSRHTFTAVDSKGELHNGGADYGRASTGKTMETTLKPGQGYDDVYSAIVVPAAGPIPKLIFNQGRMGTSEEVIRYPIGTSPNIIAPLPEFVRDPSDSTNASALPNVPAKMGVTYPSGMFDQQVVSAAFSSDPIAGNAPEDGKRFLIVTVSIKNRMPIEETLYGGLYTVQLKDSDGETENSTGALKTKRDEEIEQKLQPGEEYVARWYFTLPTATTGKTLTVGETDYRAYSYDVTGVK